MIIEITKKDKATLKYALNLLIESQQDCIDHSKLAMKLEGMR